jgi:hypothetical protein
MRCFELTDRRVVEGLRVYPGTDLPHVPPERRVPHVVKVSSDGELFFPLDVSITPVLQRMAEVRPGSVPRMHCAMVMPDGESLTSCRPSQEALVRIDVTAGRGGKVFLTAANDRGEVVDGRRITRCFGPFPSLGVAVLMPMTSDRYDKRPWSIGMSRLELAAVMMAGASFRIHRTVPPPGVRATSYVDWTGHQLKVTGKVAESSYVEADPFGEARA